MLHPSCAATRSPSVKYSGADVCAVVVACAATMLLRENSNHSAMLLEQQWLEEQARPQASSRTILLYFLSLHLP